MSNEPLSGEGGLESWTEVTLAERWVWLLAAMGATGVVYVAYVATHPYPAYAGGLYLEIAEQISQNGYGLPAHIPGYTSEGVPFAYPPLMFYVAAVLVEGVGVDPITYTRLLPGLVVIAALVPYYGIAEEVLGDTRQAGLATLLLGLTPTTLRWHLSAGGIVRAPAFLLALVGIYVGIRLFRTHDRKWLLAGTVVFGLLVMTHPTYSVFVVISYLLVYAAYDRTLRGLAAGATVGVGGLLLATPWLSQVVATHGLDIFTTAAGTHGGLGGGLYRLGAELAYPLDDFDVEWPFFVAAYAGGAYALWKRRFLLPAWVVAPAYLIGKGRFLFVAGSMLTAVLVFEVVLPRIRASDLEVVRARTATAATLLVVILGATTAGTLYGAGAVVAAHEQSHGQPQTLDDSDLAAMQWIEGNTAPSADVAALGDSAEWLPYLTDRTIVLGPWGVEWKNTGGYYHQIALYDEISACEDAACISDTLDREGLEPDYVYVPLGDYTVRGKEHEQSSAMLYSLVASPRYDIEFVNDGVIVARVVDDAGGSSATSTLAERRQGERTALATDAPARGAVEALVG